jgi:ABC-type phosphate transport system substrate-binding protein
MASAGAAMLGSFGAIAPAQAQGFHLDIMGGGATFPSILYRQIMDCLWTPLGDGTDGPGPMPINSHCPSFPFGDTLNQPYLRMYYAPVGSGNGKAVIKTNNNQNLATISASNIVPYTSSIYPTYKWPQGAGYHFTGSDDSWTAADVAAWNAPCPGGATGCLGGAGPSPQAQWGNLIQLPAVAGPVTIPYTGTDFNGNALHTTAGNGKINLSRKALCGIFSGHITLWSNSTLAADNGVVSVGSGQITVVHRSDGSGTNFLFTSALAAQCQFQFGPNSETDATLVSYAFPWTDHSGACPFLEANGSNTNNWPDQFNPDQCGHSNPVPGTAHFINGSGNSGVITGVKNNPGSIGYSTADQVLPIAPSGPPAANIQSQFDLNVGNGQFEPPTTDGTSKAMGSIIPVFDNTTRGNPLAWTGQSAVPNPGAPGAYPIAGFTWMDVYQCYAAGGVNVPVFLNTYFAGLYGADSIGLIINDNGFIRPPYPWLVEIYNLLNDPTLQPNLSGNGDCVGIPGAH